MKLNYISSNAVNFSINKKVLAVLAAIVLSFSTLTYEDQATIEAEVAAYKATSTHNITREDLAKAFPEYKAMSEF